MRTIKLYLMMMGIFLTSMLYAQKVGGNDEFEEIKIGSRNYSRVKTGFFAPSDRSLGIAYDFETPHFSYDEYSTKPLDGGRISSVIHAPLSKKGILSIECPADLRVNYVKDTKLRGNYKSLYRWDGGTSFGILLSTGYCFRENCYVTIGGGVVLYFNIEETTIKTKSGNKTKIGNVEYENELTKLFDVSISFSTSFRYKRLGIRANYDIGTINRYNKKYYEETGNPKSYTKKNDHFCIGIQYYFM